ncbi:hypothetical protein A2863_03945 [Candidatus Woesebacteria bacterium RIFCSPHIGHO2_01_FULL_38_9b]|uniref:Nitroreductase domain-containing protein n=1 Tax=Candidatus Woesebacteria bacterium RIFCSPHIGHO2_01_FULL_38_9b TaxID=1802493 RepID=A0A1F7Y407_9BACT|nr:MAG: hypothetical protein A2863_03945 [Candidatus Woesebacteria bacterium RIFCSPHIGHO2_01_FULL_38_9b]
MLENEGLTVWNIRRQDFPWKGSIEEKIKFLLGYAILAPSTHNVQPWLVKVKRNSCEVYADRTIKLPQADPKGGYLYISLGAFIKNLIIASKYFSMFERVTYFPKKNLDLVAEVFFKKSGSKKNVNKKFEMLLGAVPQRKNNRGLFRRKKIPEYILRKIEKISTPSGIRISYISDSGSIGKLAKLTAGGIRTLYSKKAFRYELAGFINHNLSTKRKGIPAYALKMPTPLSFIFSSLMRLFDMSVPIARVNYKSISSVPLICVISSKNDDPKTWLEIGRMFEALTLCFEASNVDTSIFVAALEIDSLRKQVKKISKARYEPRFLFCAGYIIGEIKHTPRNDVEEILMH